ncbi:carboxypeptidase regulatory-like domain-containing protein [Candidatus Palauibacter sp.]|uniref:carboxypeptidase regulatory-like domain-containing protein n=1 Tax=Candidatus Palauibacter sp. TaxID=3101350 RepID=UPI003B02C226
MSLAQISITALNTGTLSDVDGRWTMESLPPGTYDVVARLIGYTSKTITGATVTAGDVTTIDISLPPQAIEMTELSVTVADQRGTASAFLVVKVMWSASSSPPASRIPRSITAATSRRAPSRSAASSTWTTRSRRANGSRSTGSSTASPKTSRAYSRGSTSTRTRTRGTPGSSTSRTLSSRAA